MTNPYTALREQIEEDIGASYPLKRVAKEWDKRDVLDALRDAEILVRLFHHKFYESIKAMER